MIGDYLSSVDCDTYEEAVRYAETYNEYRHRKPIAEYKEKWVPLK